MNEELEKLHDLQSQILQLKHEIAQLNSQLYRQSNQILDVKEVLAEDKFIQAKILSTLDSLSNLVDTVKIKLEKELQNGEEESVQDALAVESSKSKNALNYVTIAYNISLILLTMYQLYSSVIKGVIGGTSP